MIRLNICSFNTKYRSFENVASLFEGNMHLLLYSKQKYIKMVDNIQILCFHFCLLTQQHNKMSK